MTPQNTSDTGERVSTFVSTLANFEGLKFIITLFLRAKLKKERVIGIEPNEHQIRVILPFLFGFFKAGLGHPRSRGLD